MQWPFKFWQRRPEERVEQQLRFVGERVGPPERQLKTALVALLASHPNIQRAYLVRVVFNDSTPHDIVLALRSVSGADAQFVREAGNLFAQQFRRDAYLDIMFMSEEQEIQAAGVCRPFYNSP